MTMAKSFFKRSIDGGKTFEKTINMGNNTGLFGIPQISVSKDIVGNTNSNCHQCLYGMA